MPMWADFGYDFIIYPQAMTEAMRYTYQVFVETLPKDKAAWLSLQFKKKRIQPLRVSVQSSQAASAQVPSSK